MKKLFFAPALLLSLIMFFECKKKAALDGNIGRQDGYEDGIEGIVMDEFLVQNTSCDLTMMGCEIFESGILYTYKENPLSSNTPILGSPSCATLSILDKVVTVDFGTDGCLGKDGRTRKGKLFYDFSSCPITAVAFRIPGFTFNVSSENYKLDGLTVKVNYKKVTNITPAGIIGQTLYNGIDLTWQDTTNIFLSRVFGLTSKSIYTATLINANDPNCYKGQFTPINWTKAKIQFSGTSSGIEGGGDSFTSTSANILRDFTCIVDTLYPNKHPFIGGILELKPSTKILLHLDYGAGTCDLKTLITAGTHTSDVYNLW